MQIVNIIMSILTVLVWFTVVVTDNNIAKMFLGFLIGYVCSQLFILSIK